VLRAAFISLSESKSIRSAAEKTWIGARQRDSRRKASGRRRVLSKAGFLGTLANGSNTLPDYV
jgi:hypothetical protein